MLFRSLDLVSYATLLAGTDNDAYNTLVATDLAHQFGRDAVFQLARDKDNKTRHALPATLGGRAMVADMTYGMLEQKMYEGWAVRISRLTDEYLLEDWRAQNPDSMLVAAQRKGEDLRILHTGENLKGTEDMQLIHLSPPRADAEAKVNAQRALTDDPAKEGPSAS